MPKKGQWIQTILKKQEGKKKKNTNNTPLEEDEQKAFVQWLEWHKVKFSSIPNSTYTKSWNQKRKNTAMGLRAGLPDMLILWKDKIVFIELKRIKGGIISPEQESWIEELGKCGGYCMVCYGHEEAEKFLESL